MTLENLFHTGKYKLKIIYNRILKLETSCDQLIWMFYTTTLYV